jgi:tripartite-type tricarboxylate transporter receptor subunit TctC
MCPTMAEAGVPGLESGTWYGVLAPARTPQAVDRPHLCGSGQDLAAARYQARLLAQGVDIVGSSPQQFPSISEAKSAKWAKVIKDANVRAE